jgi:hypothetical protein
MHARRRLATALVLTCSGLAGVACEGEEKPAAVAEAPVSLGHISLDSATGIALDLPADWRGRYRNVRGITERAEGLLDEVALRYIRADSTVSADSSLIVARVFTADGYRRIADDSVAITRFGGIATRDTERSLILTLRLSTGNPFTPGTADALGYDTLMISLFSRPIRAGVGKPLYDTAAVRK